MWLNRVKQGWMTLLTNRVNVPSKISLGCNLTGFYMSYQVSKVQILMYELPKWGYFLMLQNGHYVNVIIWDYVILYHQIVCISNNVMIWECYEMGFFIRCYKMGGNPILNVCVTKWVFFKIDSFHNKMSKIY